MLALVAAAHVIFCSAHFCVSPGYCCIPGLILASFNEFFRDLSFCVSCKNDPRQIIHKKIPVLNSSSSFSRLPNHSTSPLLNRKTLRRATRQEAKEYYAIRNLTRIPRMPRCVLFNRSVRYPCILMTNTRSITNKLNDFESLLHAITAMSLL